MRWSDIFSTIDDWTERLREPAREFRKRSSHVYAGDRGYYMHPDTLAVRVFDYESPNRSDAEHISADELAEPANKFVKIAYSKSLRTVGENLNFFPGQHLGAIPNHPSPIAAMLTTGVLGGGLGYGLGHAARSILPDRFGDKVPLVAALGGAALGTAPGLLWGLLNRKQDLAFNDASLLADKYDPNTKPSLSQDPLRFVPEYLDKPAFIIDNEDDLERAVERAIELAAPRYALIKRGDAFAPDRFVARGPADVNIDAVGRTLWNAGMDPATTATTMGTLYAAQQLPDPRSEPGWATAGQLGRLALNTAGEYGHGVAAGYLINKLIGTPYSSGQIGAGYAGLQLLSDVVPRIFGGR